MRALLDATTSTPVRNRRPRNARNCCTGYEASSKALNSELRICAPAPGA
ncbi:hypothetical protein [Streptomyces sp. NBC_00243]|nr:hypothetical protein [Streptomyces sp. NBC_00243]